MNNDKLMAFILHYTDNKGKRRRAYYDKHGTEIVEGCRVRFDDGRIKTMHLTEEGELGEDMTNPRWIEKGWAVECEYGILPLTVADCAEAEVI